MTKPTVLLVEDDDDLRTSLAAALADEGYEIREATGGNEAISLLGQALPDLVILDMMMPDGNGWDVIDHLRGPAGNARVPIVVISAYASSVPRGARALLRKPVRRGDLIATAATYVRTPV